MVENTSSPVPMRRFQGAASGHLLASSKSSAKLSSDTSSGTGLSPLCDLLTELENQLFRVLPGHLAKRLAQIFERPLVMVQGVGGGVCVRELALMQMKGLQDPLLKLADRFGMFCLFLKRVSGCCVMNHDA